MPKQTPYETGRIWAQIVATIVATRHPQVATVERSVKRRGAKVYVDYLQNIEGKTLACAYSARASEFAGASTPLTWDEVDAGVDRRDFTIQHAAGAAGGGRRPLEGALEGEGAGFAEGRAALALAAHNAR